MHIKEVSDRMTSVHDVMSSCAQVHTDRDNVIHSKLLSPGQQGLKPSLTLR